MSRSQLVGLSIAVLVAGAVILLWPREEVAADELIRRQVVQMARAAEEKDLDGVMEHISPRFRHARGWGRDELRRFLAAQLLRGEWVRVFVVGPEVHITGPGSAEMSGKFVLARSDAPDLKSLAQQTIVGSWRIEGTLEREADGEWRFVSATHRPEDVL